MTRIDVSGERYGRLVAISFSRRHKNQSHWLFKCDCGKAIETVLWYVRSGHKRSCGCLQKEWLKERHLQMQSHGMSKTRFYGVWAAMKRRCDTPSVPEYKYYGARGVGYSNPWSDFLNFKEDMYESYLDHVAKHGRRNTTLERVDNDGNYSLENCKWETRFNQGANKRNNRILTLNKESKPLIVWSRELGLSKSKIEHRLKRGWTVERALTTK